MKKLSLIACMLFLVSTVLIGQNKYIGAAKCKMCHNPKANSMTSGVLPNMLMPLKH